VCVQKLEPTPTANLDRTKDAVYDSTTSVVRAVMGLSQGVQAHQAHLYLDLVKKVGSLSRARKFLFHSFVNIAAKVGARKKNR
jgi:focal adhesion kinase 1